jgi:RNA polymerase subunit RPABC4/transcription elongation factor Spt4
MATCSHPQCTGIHDNNRYSELCPRSLDRKRDKDWRYYSITVKGFRARMAKKYGIPVAVHQALLRRLKTDPDGVVAELMQARYPQWFETE